MPKTLAAQLDAAGLLPPWVQAAPWPAVPAEKLYRDTRTEFGSPWHPEQDYQYAFWLMDQCHMVVVPAYAGLEDIPQVVIRHCRERGIVHSTVYGLSRADWEEITHANRREGATHA